MTRDSIIQDMRAFCYGGVCACVVLLFASPSVAQVGPYPPLAQGVQVLPAPYVGGSGVPAGPLFGTVGSDCTALTIPYSFSGDTDTGITSVSANTHSGCAGATEAWRATATAFNLAGTLGIGSIAGDATFARLAAGQIGSTYTTDGVVSYKIDNNSAGASAYALLQVQNDNNHIVQMGITSSVNTYGGVAGSGFIEDNSTGGLSIMGSNSTSGEIRFYTDGNAAGQKRWTINNTGELVANTSMALSLAGKAFINTAPSGPVACTSPTVTNSNGTAAFQIDVGSTCAGVSTLVVTMPTATNAWACSTATNVGSAATRYLAMTASTTTSITFTNFSRTLGTAVDFADGDDVRAGGCIGG